jgi:hypothetical protein
MPISIPVTPGFPADAGGIMIKTQASDAVDNVFIFQDPAGQKWRRIVDGPYRAQWALKGDGTNQLSALNAILAHSSVKEVIFDNPAGADYTFTGTLTIPTGKIIHLTHNNRIIGSVTINGNIHCHAIANVFGTTVKLNNAKSATGFWSVKNFGAVGDDTADDTTSFQAAVNTILRTYPYPGTATLFVPAGRYKLTME